MSEDNKPNLIEFKSEAPSNGAKLVRSKRKYEHRMCSHEAVLEIDEDSQLVTCSKCGFTMSAFNALMIICMEREDIPEEIAAWEKMKREKNWIVRGDAVRRRRRELQWIEIPDEDDEPARSNWLLAREALGMEPYAMYRQGKPPEYYIMDEKGGGQRLAYLLAKPKLVRAEQ